MASLLPPESVARPEPPPLARERDPRTPDTHPGPPARPAPAPRPPAPGRGSSGQHTGGWLLAIVVLVVGMFMSVLDTTIVNVAVPAIQSEFGSTPDDIQWISTAYSLALGVVVPLSGWLGDRIGITRTYLLSLVGFALGSALCGLAWDLPSMVFFRILQAVPGGIMPVVTMTMLYRIAPKEKIGVAMALFGLGVVFAPGIGPTLGGYLVEYQNWRLIFFINVPIGLLGALVALFVLPRFAKVPVGPFDVWGFVSAAGALFGLLLALSEGQIWGWTSYPILALIAGSVDLLALFVVIELTVAEPLFDLRVFARWQFTNSLLLVTTLSVGLYAVVFYVPLYLQEYQLRTPLHTGLLMLPEAVAMAFIMPLAGQVYDRFGPRWLAVSGLAVAAYASWLLTGINVDITPGEVMFWVAVRGFGNGLSMMAIMTAGLAVVPADKVNQASALSNVAQRVSAALGLAILTSMASTQSAQFWADRSALVPAVGPAVAPRVAAVRHQGTGGLIPLWRELQAQVHAQAYSNVFLAIALFTAAGAVLGFMMRKPDDPAGTSADTDAAIMIH
jgi:EmrB/QacA subfamily drug resistance transporter